MFPDQMTYSLQVVTKGYANKQNLTKIFIQVIYQRIRVYAPTIVQVPEDCFKNGVVIKHVLKTKYNHTINEQRREIETRLIDAIAKHKVLTKEQLTDIVKGDSKRSSGKVGDYIHHLRDTLKDKISEGRIKHYKTIEGQIDLFAPDIDFSHVNVKWMNSFEAWLRNLPGKDGKMDGNTIQTKMNLLKSVFNKAAVDGLIEKEQFDKYKRPRYEQKLPEYLTEPELLRIKSFCDSIDKPGHKLAGYYFLLSSYTGYRISDAKRFNPAEMIRGNTIILRAQKNGKIVAIPIYPQLQAVLDFVSDHPLKLSEQKVREYVKEICSFVGIKKHVKYHCSRHSFAMLLIDKGFTIDEIAQLLGDTAEIAKVYARMSNTHLAKKFNTLMQF